MKTLPTRTDSTVDPSSFSSEQTTATNSITKSTIKAANDSTNKLQTKVTHAPHPNCVVLNNPESGKKSPEIFEHVIRRFNIFQQHQSVFSSTGRSSTKLPKAFRNLRNPGVPFCESKPWLKKHKDFLFFLFVNALFFVEAAVTWGLLSMEMFQTQILTAILNPGPEVVIVLVTLTVVIACLSLFGCLGVWLSNPLVIKLYRAILLFILTIQVVLMAAALYVYFTASEGIIEVQLLQSLQTRYSATRNPFSDAFNLAQIFFGCCGVTSWRNFRKTTWFINATAQSRTGNSTRIQGSRRVHIPQGLLFPITCCELKDPDLFMDGDLLKDLKTSDLREPRCLTRPPSRDNRHTTTPCAKVIKSYLFYRAGVTLFLALLFMILQIAGGVDVTNILSAIARKNEAKRGQPQALESGNGGDV